MSDVKPSFDSVKSKLSETMTALKVLDKNSKDNHKYIQDCLDLFKTDIVRLTKFEPFAISDTLDIAQSPEDINTIVIRELNSDSTLSIRSAEYIDNTIGADKFGQMVVTKLESIRSNIARINDEAAVRIARKP